MNNNFINVVLENNDAYPGQTIKGTVYVGAYFESGGSVSLRMRGVESCEFTYFITRRVPNGWRYKYRGSGKRRRRVRVRRYKTIRIKKHAGNSFEIYNDFLDLTPGGLGSGEFAFPFTFIVPQGCPASFRWHETSENHAQVAYSIIGTYGTVSDTEHIQIKQRVPEGYRSSFLSKDQEVKCCCCIGKGNIKLGASFEKDHYSPGETVQMRVQVDASSSDYPVDRIRGEAYCLVILYGYGRTDGSSRTKRIKIPAGGMTANGVEEGKKTQGVIPLNFTLTAREEIPTVQGRVVRSEYILKVSAEIEASCVCSDTPVVSLPVVVHRVPPVIRIFQRPAQFAPQMMPMQTIPIAMPLNPPPMPYNPARMINPQGEVPRPPPAPRPPGAPGMQQPMQPMGMNYPPAPMIAGQGMQGATNYPQAPMQYNQVGPSGQGMMVAKQGMNGAGGGMAMTSDRQNLNYGGGMEPMGGGNDVFIEGDDVEEIEGDVSGSEIGSGEDAGSIEGDL